MEMFRFGLPFTYIYIYIYLYVYITLMYIAGKFSNHMDGVLAPLHECENNQPPFQSGIQMFHFRVFTLKLLMPFSNYAVFTVVFILCRKGRHLSVNGRPKRNISIPSPYENGIV